MYVRQSTWIEAGPRRGLGQAVQTSPLLNSEQLTDADYLAGLPSEGTCFLPVLPFFGDTVDGGRACRPVVRIPEPWPVVLTVGIGGLLAYRLFRGVLG